MARASATWRVFAHTTTLLDLNVARRSLKNAKRPLNYANCSLNYAKRCVRRNPKFQYSAPPSEESHTLGPYCLPFDDL
jgi:hypothetical protein